MSSGRRRTTPTRFTLWAVLVIALAITAYLAGAQLARLWATPLAQQMPTTPTAISRAESLVSGETAYGTLGPEMMGIWQFYADAGQFATLEIRVDPLDASSPEAGFGLDLTGPEGVLLVHEAGSVSLPPYVEQTLPTGGNYRVRVIPLSGSLGRYSLRLILTDEAYLTAATGIITATIEAVTECRAYTVVEGDTVWHIAQRFGVAPDEVIAANVDVLIPPYDMLLEGQELCIPKHGISDGYVPDCSPVPERERPIEYVVQFSENLTCLAQKFGLKQETILWANLDRLTWDPDLIHFGQTLIIPPVDSVLHTVAEGETLGSIAEQYQVEVADIVAWGPNWLEPQSVLIAGHEIVIPSGVPPFHLWSLPAEPTPSAPTTPSPAAPGVTPPAPGATPLPPVADIPPAPDGVGYVNPFTFVSEYDSGYCSNHPAGRGWSGGLSWPTSSREIHPRRGFRQGHPAIDILAPVGAPVYAAGTGVVVWAGYNIWGYGNLVILDHGGGWQTLYAHLSSVAVGCGQTAGRGQVIGTIGQTGASSFEHLHFELRRHGYNYNPLNWLP